MTLNSYYKKYFSRFWFNIHKSMKWKQLLLIPVSLIIGSLIYFYFFGISQMQQEIFNYIAFTISPLIFVSIIFLLYLGIKVHSDLYSELENEAYLRTWRDIDAQEYYFPHVYGSMVGLIVVNYKKPDPDNGYLPIINASPVIVGINIDGEDQPLKEEKRLHLIQMKDGKIYKITDEIMNQKYLPHDFSVIRLAKVENNQANILLADKDTIVIIEGMVYRFKILVKSQIDYTKDIEPCYIFVELVYNPRKIQDQVLKINIVDRHPKFR